jgi:hypothetical protein
MQQVRHLYVSVDGDDVFYREAEPAGAPERDVCRVVGFSNIPFSSARIGLYPALKPQV